MGKLAALGRSRAATDFINTALGLQAARQSQERLGLAQRADERAAEMHQMKMQQMQQMKQEYDYYNEDVSLAQNPLYMMSTKEGKQYFESAWNEATQGHPTMKRWRLMKFVQERPQILSGLHKAEIDAYSKQIESATSTMQKYTQSHPKYQEAALKRNQAMNKLREVNASINAAAKELNIPYEAPQHEMLPIEKPIPTTPKTGTWQEGKEDWIDEEGNKWRMTYRTNTTTGERILTSQPHVVEGVPPMTKPEGTEERTPAAGPTQMIRKPIPKPSKLQKEITILGMKYKLGKDGNYHLAR